MLPLLQRVISTFAPWSRKAHTTPKRSGVVIHPAVGCDGSGTALLEGKSIEKVKGPECRDRATQGPNLYPHRLQSAALFPDGRRVFPSLLLAAVPLLAALV